MIVRCRQVAVHTNGPCLSSWLPSITVKTSLVSKTVHQVCHNVAWCIWVSSGWNITIGGLIKCRCMNHTGVSAGKAATAIKAAADKTATAVISGSPEDSRLHPAAQSVASSSPAQKAALPAAPQAAPSSPAPRALQPTASRPLSSPAQNASQAASPGLPVPQSSLTRSASQTTPLRPQRPVRDLTNSIEGARGVAAEVKQHSKCFDSHPIIFARVQYGHQRGQFSGHTQMQWSQRFEAALMAHLAIRTACVSGTMVLALDWWCNNTCWHCKNTVVSIPTAATSR